MLPLHALQKLVHFQSIQMCEEMQHHLNRLYVSRQRMLVASVRTMNKKEESY